MADAPKGKPKEPEKPNIANATISFVAIVVIILFVLSSFIEKNNISNVIEEGTKNPDSFKVSNLFPTGDIEQGSEVLTKSIVKVRREPAGTVLGEQDSRSIARVSDGPVNSFGKTWWLLQFEQAPDGWVDSNEITAKIGTYKSVNIFSIIYDGWKPIGWFLSAIFFFLIIVISMKGKVLASIIEKQKMLEEREVIKDRELPNVEPVVPGLPYLPNGPDGLDLNVMSADPNNIIPTNHKTAQKQWARITDFIKSQNENDWKQGIMEADILLEQMLERMGYPGTSIGERLKQVEKFDFVSVGDAWEAHKVRNRIAHDGHNFKLSKYEAERVWKLYKKVFDEFYYI